jgi:dihydroorotate dehydrogenase (NAD+) catalytic subunit
MADPRLLTRLPRGVVLRDPLLLASGCCGYGEEYSDIVDPATIGGVITKAVSPELRLGNPLPRLRETPAGLLNCIGLQNPGVEKFAGEILPRLEALGITVIVNVVGKKAPEFAEVVRRVEERRSAVGSGVSLTAVGTRVSASAAVTGIASEQPSAGATHVTHSTAVSLTADPTADALKGVPTVDVTVGFAGYELDLSCPNVESGTMFATDEDLLVETVARCRAETDALIVAKLSPNVTDIVVYAEAAVRGGADAVTISNTLNGISIDTRTRRSHLARPSAGLSGGAIRPAVLYHVWRCHRALPELPILGSGGITDTDSAIQFLLAGATALQLGTGMFVNPALPAEIRDELPAYLEQQGESSVMDIIGTYRA